MWKVMVIAMNEVSPCKGCTNRHTACHGSCEMYKAWQDRYHAQQKHLDANKNRWGTPWTAAMESRYRGSTKFGAGGSKYGGVQ